MHDRGVRQTGVFVAADGTDATAPVVAAGPARAWTFLSNHGHVLVHVSRQPQSRLRDIAAAVGITERSAQMILADLEDGGYVTKVRVGRRNHYEVHPERGFRHPAEASHPVGQLLHIFTDAGTWTGTA